MDAAYLKQSPNKVGFFDLPREIRDKIYEHIVDVPLKIGDQTFEGDGPAVMPGWDWYGRREAYLKFEGENPPGLRCAATQWLAILSRVSRQFRAEARPVFLGSWKFIVLEKWRAGEWKTIFTQLQPDALPGLALFLNKLGPDASLLRQIDVHHDIYSMPNCQSTEAALNGCGISHLPLKDLLIHFRIGAYMEIRSFPAEIDCRMVEDGHFKAEMISQWWSAV